jgi:hypothetical protein
MKRTLICLALIFGSWAFTKAPAQQPSSSSKTQMYEDIEVMGRILDRALHLPRGSRIQLPVTTRGFGGGFGGMGAFGGGGLGGPIPDVSLQTGTGGGGLGPQIADPSGLGLGGGQAGGGLGLGGLGLGGGQMGFAGGQGFSGGGTIRNVSVPTTAYPRSQGTYLKGYGVVYSIVLPPPKPEPASPAPSPPPTQSEWDRVRKQIRGEKSTPPPPLPKAKEPSVPDVVLEVLAKNGFHFSQLGDQESITVSILFRPEEPTRLRRIAIGGDQIPRYDIKPRYDLRYDAKYDVNAIHQGAFDDINYDFGATSDADPFSILSEDVEPANPPDETPPLPKADEKGLSNKKKPAADTGGGSSPTTSSDYELLGDLRLKQGQGSDALRAYQQALAKSSDNQEAAALYLKLAQLYLTVQKDELQAQQALHTAQELLSQTHEKNVSPNLDKNVSTPTPPSPLPARLIITAPKRLLTQVGSGKMSLDDFKKAASVEHLSFSGGK